VLEEVVLEDVDGFKFKVGVGSTLKGGIGAV
jgi:hypothetical protein